MVSVPELTSVDPAPYVNSATAWRTAAESMSTRADDLAAARRRLGTVWDSPAADAAAADLLGLVNRLDAANSAMMSLDQTLSVHHDGLLHAKAMLAEAEGSAAASGIRINNSGDLESATPGVMT